MPPVKELRWPSRIGALLWARSAGAARFDVSAAPAAAECLTKVRRDRRAPNDRCLFMAFSLGARLQAGCLVNSRQDYAGLARAFRRGRSSRNAERSAPRGIDRGVPT